MIFHILKKDLKRRKTMNVILLMFVIVATMFVASGVSNTFTVVNGTGYFFDKAEVGDFAFLTMGSDKHGYLEGKLDDKDYISSVKIEDVIFSSQGCFFDANGKELEIHNAAILQSLEDSQMNFFDLDNQIVNSVEKGKVYLTARTMNNNDLKVGDKIQIKLQDVELNLEIKGQLKDAFLGSSMIGNGRFLLNPEDYKLLDSNEIICRRFGGQICYVQSDDVEKVMKDIASLDGVAFRASRNLMTMGYLMDMVVAGVVLVVSICLIIISFVVLKFTISFTLAEEFREIGVMKAIGIKSRKIQSIYIVKYLAIAICGAVIGFFLSIPFAKLLIQAVSTNMVLGNDTDLLIHAMSAIVVVLVIVGYANLCTQKLKKYSAIDAIRSGQTGERFKKKTVYRIGKSHFRPSSYMALNDVISSPKRYLTIILAFTISALLVLIVVNTTETMRSEKLVTTFSKRSDIYFTNNAKAMESMTGKGHDSMETLLDEFNEKLKEQGMDAKTCVDVQFSFPVEFDGEVNGITCQQGIRTKADEYVYYEGSAPKDRYEIAITEQISQLTGAKIGDKVKITIGDQTDEYLVTAYFETMNQMGEILRLHEDVPTDMADASSVFPFQIDFLDHPNQKVIDERRDQLKKFMDSEDVFNTAEFSADCIGVVDTMEAVGYLLLAITIIVVILVSILMERSFISDEKGEIALLKAMGFKDREVIAWHIKRFVLVGLIAILVAIALSIPMTQLTITPIFKMLGMKQVSYKFDIVKIFGLYPAIILVVTLISAGLTSCYTKTIKCSDTANIE